MNSLAIGIVHPAFEQLKRLGRFLHLVAGLLIMIHAFNQLRQPTINYLYFWCLLIVSIDIIILALISRNLVQEMPRVNLIFRFIECVMFVGVALLLLFASQWIMGFTIATVGIAYIYLFYCEKKVKQEESITFLHTGIWISGIPEGKFFLWTHIDRIQANYDEITIHTAFQKTLVFPLRKNLQFEELEQIHDFCRHYIGN